jgi:capsid assembly protease
MKSLFAELNKPWAIHPAALEELISRAASPDQTREQPAALSARSGPEMPEDILSIENGVATIKIHGVLTKQPIQIGWDSWTTGMEVIGAAFRQALANSRVDAIVLDIDSPGGSVDGTPDLAAEIAGARGKKPIIAFANGMMVSAAYWIGSAADVIIASEAAMVGSIGVAMAHYDLSGLHEKCGVKKTSIYAGKFKRLASDEKPLTDEAREYLQSMVDSLYSMFVGAVANHRGVSLEKALAMADGKDFIGKQAHAVGLIDSVGSRGYALTITSERRQRFMDLKTLQENHADLYAQVIAMGVEQGKKEAEAGVAEARQTGAATECTRILSLLDAGADPKVTRQAIENGMTAGEAYKAFFEAEKAKKADALAGMAAGATKPVGHQIPSNPMTAGDAAVKYEAEVVRLMGEGKSRGQAVTAIAKSNPDMAEAYLQAINKK